MKPAEDYGSTFRSSGVGRWLWSKLSRVTRSGKLIPQIDGLRFVAIGTVLLFHLGGHFVNRFPEHAEAAVGSPLFTLTRTGDIGVKLFFGISGFILALPFLKAALGARRRVHLGSYFIRRLTRLEPPYILNLLIAYALLVLVKDASASELAPNLGASLVYQHNLIYEASSRINFVAWSLEIEVQFYALMPLIALLFTLPAIKRRLALLGLLLASAGAATWAEHGTSPVLLLTIAANLHWFMVGILLADVFLVELEGNPSPSKRWDLYGLVAWLSIIGLMIERTRLPVDFLIPPAVFVAYVAAFRGPLWSRLFSWTPFVLIGGMCYTIYLYHTLIFSAVTKALAHVDIPGGWPVKWIIFYGIQLAIVVAVGSVLFALFERPFMKRWWRPRAAAAARAKSADQPKEMQADDRTPQRAAAGQVGAEAPR